LNNSQLDDVDIYRERRNLFFRCNMQARRFYSCPVAVKLRLFKSFACVFMMRRYGIILLQALWTNLDQRMSNALRYFFRYTKYYSVTTMLTELNLHKFDTVIDKCRSNFQCQIHACENGIVQHFVYLHLM